MEKKGNLLLGTKLRRLGKLHVRKIYYTDDHKENCSQLQHWALSFDQTVLFSSIC